MTVSGAKGNLSSCATRPGMAPTGVARTMSLASATTSARSVEARSAMPSAWICATAASLRAQRWTRSAAAYALLARATEPPSSPGPRMAMVGLAAIDQLITPPPKRVDGLHCRIGIGRFRGSGTVGEARMGAWLAGWLPLNRYGTRKIFPVSGHWTSVPGGRGTLFSSVTLTRAFFLSATKGL